MRQIAFPSSLSIDKSVFFIILKIYVKSNLPINCDSGTFEFGERICYMCLREQKHISDRF